MKSGRSFLTAVRLATFTAAVCADVSGAPSWPEPSAASEAIRSVTNAPTSSQGEMNRIFVVLAAPDCSDEAFARALGRLTNAPALQNPGPWISLVENTNLAPGRRRQCFYALLRKYVPPGTKIQDAALLFRGTTWIREDTVTCATAFSHLPADLKPGECVYRLQLPFMRRPFAGGLDQGGVYFYITPGRVSGSRLLLLLNLKDTETIYDIIITRIEWYDDESPQL
jgi:hypothetical protein